MSRRFLLKVSAIPIALAFSFTACLVADPGDYQRGDTTSTTGEPSVGNPTMEDGHVHP
jgi:hypothetical protein